MESDDRDYQVGYCRPPLHTRFQKGQSGNPKGRPRGAKNMATLFNEALRERVTVSENGQRRRITKQKALVKNLVNKAISGDRRLLQLLLAEMRLIEARSDSSASTPQPLDEADRQVVRQLHERIRRWAKEGEDRDGSEQN